MPSDKQVLYQILEREIDNLMGGFGPIAGMFSGTIKNFIFSKLDPYVDAFLFPNTDKINTKAASSFVKEEVNSKVNEFLKKFEKESNNPNDYIV